MRDARRRLPPIQGMIGVAIYASLFHFRKLLVGLNRSRESGGSLPDLQAVAAGMGLPLVFPHLRQSPVFFRCGLSYSEALSTGRSGAGP